MKTFISKIGLAVLTVLFSFGYASAADLIVEENGVLPNYATIQDAVNAASPGDRIFIKNKSGGIPYQENVAIDKPLELLAFDSNGSFLVFGNYTISANGANFSSTLNTLTIIGMHNVSGSITASSNNSTGSTIYLNVLSNQLEAGSINLSGTDYVSHVAGNWLESGGITTRYSTISGNLVNGAITINASTVSTEDTLYVVGNRVTTDVGAMGGGYIAWNNADQYFHIANNWVRSNYTGGLYRITAQKNGAGTNMIVNNSAESSDSNSEPVVNFTGTVPAGCRIKVENNAGHDLYNSSDSGTEYWIQFGSVASGALVEVNYNVYEGYEAFTNVGGTLVSYVSNQAAPTTYEIDDVTGICAAAECVNAGSPAVEHTDHDLSRNDRGVAGGSYRYSNFFPILTGAARVYLVKTPRKVVQTSIIRAEADAHDR